MAAIYLRAAARNVFGILMYPAAASIEKMFAKNGAALGTIILAFIFVNGNWLLLFAGGALRALMQLVYPPWANIGSELASAVLLLLGSYFYSLPVGALLYLGYCLVRRKSLRPAAGPRIYLLLDYFCTASPPAIWAFTFFSFHLAIAFHQLPAAAGHSFFLPYNFFAYASLHFPFLTPSPDFLSPMLYFSLWGFILGLVGGIRLLRLENLSARGFRREALQRALAGPATAEERRFTWQVAVAYAVTVTSLILWPVLFQAATHRQEIVLRSLVAGYLLLPVFFQISLAMFRRLRRAGNLQEL